MDVYVSGRKKGRGVRVGFGREAAAAKIKNCVRKEKSGVSLYSESKETKRNLCVLFNPEVLLLPFASSGGGGTSRSELLAFLSRRPSNKATGTARKPCSPVASFEDQMSVTLHNTLQSHTKTGRCHPSCPYSVRVSQGQGQAHAGRSSPPSPSQKAQSCLPPPWPSPRRAPFISTTRAT